MSKAKGVVFLRFMIPVQKTLQQLGGSGRPAEVKPMVLEMFDFSEEELNQKNENGRSKIENQIHWARQYLVYGGYIDPSKRGIWQLTDKGMNSDILEEDVYPIFQKAATTLKKDYDIDVDDENPDLDDKTKCQFSKKTFKLFDDLHKEPKASFFRKHRGEFKNAVEAPLKNLLYSISTQLPPMILEEMESKKRLFSRIPKNDYGKGGAWDFYWGALYTKGGKRIEDAQLYIRLNKDFFEFGFYIGDYSKGKRDQFLTNCQKNQEALTDILADNLVDENLRYGHQGDGFDIVTKASNVIWKKWLADPDKYGIQVAVRLAKEEVLQLSSEELIGQVSQTYSQLFPLVLLTAKEDPMPAIGNYLNIDVDDDEDEDIRNPNYSMEQCVEDTGFELAKLIEWVEAIQRKKQVIIFGPPGTGKTFVAERLAKHLIGGGDGISDLVQFHSAYAYEDFMQGIRPEISPEGKLTYLMVPGRFLNFCSKAKKSKGTCVLIIDEINRANLARVFGELMYLLEYRNQDIPLAGDGRFQIPSNVRIIGTMNTADRSIALVDHALRRRFAFLALYPNYDVLKHYHKKTGFKTDGLIEILKNLSRQIDDRHYDVGISFFLRENLTELIPAIWKMEIEPYLEEYFFDQQQKVENFRWDKIKGKVLP